MVGWCADSQRASYSCEHGRGLRRTRDHLLAWSAWVPGRGLSIQDGSWTSGSLLTVFTHFGRKVQRAKEWFGSGSSGKPPLSHSGRTETKLRGTREVTAGHRLSRRKHLKSDLWRFQPESRMSPEPCLEIRRPAQ